MTGRIVWRYLAVGACILALAFVHLRGRPPSLCLLRSTTGVPCPFCGGTTAAARLGHGNVRGALAASPLALVMLACWPLLGVIRSPAWWTRRRVRWTVLGVTLAAAEVWQLHRFGLI